MIMIMIIKIKIMIMMIKIMMIKIKIMMIKIKIMMIKIMIMMKTTLQDGNKYSNQFHIHHSFSLFQMGK